jgi:hypothetical protein
MAGLVTLRGNTRPEAKAINDRGRVADGLPLPHLMLQLQRTPEQERALQQFIKDIHDPASPLFHHWITAAQFGAKYGVASAAITRVTEWLESQGFKVNLVYPNQMVIDFTGTAGQVRRAFHTEIHNLQVNGEAHIGNMSDPQIPAEQAATVAGVVSLNDFKPRPLFRPRPNYTPGNGSYPLVPADLWKIYNFNAAFAAGNSGQGQTIVVLEDSDLYSTADWDTFRSVLGLSAAYPAGSLVVVHPPSSPENNCNDPGTNSDEREAAVDAEWASAGAPSATIEVASCTSYMPGGPFIALQNLINSSATPPAIVSICFESSETINGAAYNAYINSLYQQAAAEGVSIFVGAGDNGPDDADVGSPYAANGINVSGFASTPYNVAVGGTDFADTYQGTNVAYWSSTNAANYGSALSYVPEIPWNDSCGSVLLSDFNGVLPTYGAEGACNQSNQNITAGGGGPSGCAMGAPVLTYDSLTIATVSGTCAGYPKPAWQSGMVGNPSDGVRDIPDVSLFASSGVWKHNYVYCLSDPNYDANCNGAPDTWDEGGGTSFSAPIMAGIQSLINQATGTAWGNPNPAYYALAASEYGSGGSTSCNSALGNKVAANCAFYDVTPIPLLHGGTGTGGDIDLPCIGANCYLPSGTYGVLSTAPQTLSSAWVVDLGSGYTTAPACTLTGGGGLGAACSASMTGVVSSIILTSGGNGYSSIPNCTLSGGGGTGATCEVLAIGGTAANPTLVSGLALTTRGSGYTSAPTCTFTGGAPSTVATCTATVSPGIEASLTAPGSGYTSMPDCVLSGGGGTGATCAAVANGTSDAYQPAYAAGPGWDFATGIGTVNVSNLVAGFVSAITGFSPPSLIFPAQALDTASSAKVLTVTNTGAGNFAISKVAIAGTNAADFAKGADTCTAATLTPDNTCTVSVTFTPSAPGSRTASLDFTDNGLNSPQAVTLSGTGNGIAVSLSPLSLTLPAQPQGSSNVEVVTLTNTGTESVTVSSVKITGPSASEFGISGWAVTLPYGDTCTGNSIAPNSTCTVGVNFSPTAAGTSNATLTFTDNAANSPQTVALIGTCAVPVVSFSAPSLTFGPQTPGTTSPVQSVNVTDTGAGLLSLWTVTLGGPNAGDFAVFPALPAGGIGGGPSDTMAVGVVFTPSAAGTRSALLIFTDNATNSPQTVALSGTGTGPAVGLSPPALTFNPQTPGTTSPAQNVTLTNTGTTSVGISTVAIGGTNANNFAKSADTCTGATVTPNNTCTVGVTFTPSAAGIRSASLTFTDKASNSPQSVALNGTGIGPAVSVSPSTLTFAAQMSGTSSAVQTVTLIDTGDATVTISGITATGDFSQTNTCGASLNANANCTISVTFKPTAGGTRSGSLSITDNAAGSPQSVKLSGTGEDFAITAASGSSMSATTSPGQSATYTLSVGGEGGMAGSVTFGCTGAPSEASCTVSPNPITAGSSATNVTITVSTTAPSFTAPRSPPTPPVPPLSLGLGSLLLLAVILVVMAWAAARLNRPRPGRWTSAALLFASGLLLALTLAGCGGGGGGGGGPAPNPGTPAGTYTLTVTGTTGSGSSTLSHSVTLTLTVS